MSLSECPKLTTIYVGDGWDTRHASGDKMFEGCYNLVGEKNTTYNPKWINILYAHVDEGENNPGYLTYKTSTGIKQPKTTLGRQSPIYNISGQRLKTPQKGVNIIGGKKVIVK